MNSYDEVGIAKGTETNDWYKWGRRVWGFDYPTPYRVGWSRKQFKAALSAMPADHPDRWKYVTGARYAPFKFGSDHFFQEWAWLTSLLFLTFAGVVLGGVFTYGIVSVAVITPWVVRAVRQHRAFQRVS